MNLGLALAQNNVAKHFEVRKKMIRSLSYLAVIDGVLHLFLEKQLKKTEKKRKFVEATEWAIKGVAEVMVHMCTSSLNKFTSDEMQAITGRAIIASKQINDQGINPDLDKIGIVVQKLMDEIYEDLDSETQELTLPLEDYSELIELSTGANVVDNYEEAITIVEQIKTLVEAGL